MSEKTGRGAALGIGIGILVVLATAVEIVLRVTDPELRVRRETAFPEPIDHLRNLHHEPDPDLLWRARAGYTRGELRISDRGFRVAANEDTTPERADVVCLGNSVTFGYTTPLYARTYPALLAERLQHACGGEVNVVNAGVIGYSSAQGRRLFETQVAPLGPRVVTILYGYNDHHLAARGDAARLAAGGSGRSIAAWLGRLRLYRALRKLLSIALPDPLAGELVERVPPELLEQNLVALARSARAAGATPILVTVPVRPSVPLVENPVLVTGAGGERHWVFQARWLTSKLPPDARGSVTRHLFANDAIDPALLVALAPVLERLVATAPDEWPLPRYLLGRALAAAGDSSAAARHLNEAALRDRERSEIGRVNDVIRRVAALERVALVDISRSLAGRPEAFDDVVHTSELGNAILADELLAPVARALGCDE